MFSDKIIIVLVKK